MRRNRPSAGASCRAFETYFEMPDPAAIEERAAAELAIDQVIADWTVSDNSADHAAAIGGLLDSGATIVNIHSGQADQQKVIDFYGNWVLPELADRVSAGLTR